MGNPSNTNKVHSTHMPDYIDSKEVNYSHPNSTKRLTNTLSIGWLLFFTLFSAFTTILTLFYVLIKISNFQFTLQQTTPHITNAHTITFGSQFYKTIEQDVWTKYVNDIQPDVWIWAGNFVYLDDQNENCYDPYNIQSNECLCKLNLLPQSSCEDFKLHDVLSKYRYKFTEPKYHEFLKTMCGDQARYGYPVNGLTCDTPILGVHGKHENKLSLSIFDREKIFLDAMGEPAHSPRYSSLNGVEMKYTLNLNNPLKEISVILLDDQHYIDPISCSALTEFCQKVKSKSLSQSTSSTWTKYCENEMANTNCCDIDDYFWNTKKNYCDKPAQEDEDFKDELCNVNNTKFGSNFWLFTNTSNSVIPSHTGRTNFCEIFGLQQRNWLYEELFASNSRVNLIVTSTPIFSNSAHPNELAVLYNEPWQSHTIAQTNFLNLLGKTQSSCIVLLSGGSQQSRIQQFTTFETNENSSLTVYQIVSGGLTLNSVDYWKETEIDENCKPENFCLNRTPTFGNVKINWNTHIMTLEVIQSQDGNVAFKLDVDLHQCTRRK